MKNDRRQGVNSLFLWILILFWFISDVATPLGGIGK
jgi:hypothetical protein